MLPPPPPPCPRPLPFLPNAPNLPPLSSGDCFPHPLPSDGRCPRPLPFGVGRCPHSLPFDGHAMLADLGFARFFTKERATINGTPMFMAPEVARGETQGTASDVWAIGCVLIEMATGEASWKDVTDVISVLHRITSESVPDSPDWMSEHAKGFLG